MELSGYSVEILGGKHFNNDNTNTSQWDDQTMRYQMRFPWGVTMNKSSGGNYVEMVHGASYKIHMNNNHPTRCNATVLIDGKSVGTWRIDPYQSIVIERPVKVDKKFVFYRSDSKSGQQAGLVEGNFDNGLVQVEFIPENKQWCREDLETDLIRPGLRGVRNFNGGDTYGLESYFSNNLALQSSPQQQQYAEGGTGLRGKSHQEFNNATKMELDRSKSVTISVRLVAKTRPTSDWHDTISPISNNISNPVPPPISFNYFN